MNIDWPKDFTELSRSTKLCSLCDKAFTSSKADLPRAFEKSSKGIQLYACGSCWATKFAECSECGGFAPKTSLYHQFCPACVPQAPARKIRKYSYKIEYPWLGKPDNGRFFGVELELEATPKSYGHATLDVSALLGEFAVLKKDASIVNGFEIVTVPASIEEQKKHWKNILSGLPSSVSPDLTCGMHVHVSRDTLWGCSDLQIGKILAFLHNPQNRRYISYIAGRPSSYHNDFTKPKCVREGKGGGAYQNDRDRHTAFNCNNAHTFEFRIFQATVDYNILAKNLDFCAALMDFTASCNSSLSEFNKMDSFLAFVRKNRKEYIDLHNFLLAHPEFTAYNSSKEYEAKKTKH